MRYYFTWAFCLAIVNLLGQSIYKEISLPMLMTQLKGDSSNVLVLDMRTKAGFEG